MDANSIELLKESANRFYLNKVINPEIESITDEEYDKLRVQYESETKLSVKDLVEWDDDISFQHKPLESLDKSAYMPNEIKETIKNDLTGINLYTINYKYDGGGIRAYYKNGLLYKVMSTPDEKFGIDRTKSYFNLFPKRVNPEIESIQGEVVVDYLDYGQKARNQANGLINSKWKQEDVENQALIRVYRLTFHNHKDWDYEFHRKMLDELKNQVIVRNRGEEYVKVFDVAESLDIDQIPSEPLVTSPSGDRIQVDGIVVYTPEWIFGYKFYYTESALVKVNKINWNYRSENGTYAPVLEFDTVTLNDKEISRCSANGAPKLIASKMGVGSVVRVILAKMTIPKVIEVIEPSEDYQFPKCECGYQLGEKDILGSSLKCGNLDVCSVRYEGFLDKIINSIVTRWEDDDTPVIPELLSVLENNPHFIANSLMIDRFVPEDKFINPIKGLVDDALGNAYYAANETESRNFLLKIPNITEENIDLYYNKLKESKDAEEIDYDKCNELYYKLAEDLVEVSSNGSNPVKEMNDKFYNIILSGTVEDFIQCFETNYNLTELQLHNAEINYNTVFKLLIDLYRGTTKVINSI